MINHTETLFLSKQSFVKMDSQLIPICNVQFSMAEYCSGR
jgi:hypothetical protein